MLTAARAVLLGTALVAACSGRSTEHGAPGTLGASGAPTLPVSGSGNGGNGTGGTTPAVGGFGATMPSSNDSYPAACSPTTGCPDPGTRPSTLPPPVCPEAEPGVGGECADEGLACSYGDSPTPHCRRYYDCAGGAWELSPANANYTCTAISDCPAKPAFEEACGEAEPGIPCVYGNVLCFCDGGYWNCFGPPANEDCPLVLPNIGDGCTEQALECNYASDGCWAPPNSTVFCHDGAWEEGEKLSCHSK